MAFIFPCRMNTAEAFTLKKQSELQHNPHYNLSHTHSHTLAFITQLYCKRLHSQNRSEELKRTYVTHFHNSNEYINTQQLALLLIGAQSLIRLHTHTSVYTSHLSRVVSLRCVWPLAVVAVQVHHFYMRGKHTHEHTCYLKNS